MYITASSTISYQPTFRNNGFSSQLSVLNNSSCILNPDYSAFIPVMERRRMSEVLKMAITCSVDCLEQSNLKQPDAIIVGTSMGCCSHTKNFLDKIISANGNLLSPTSFILSTHNTIAGQISLLLKNHGYNTTHTQNSLSFEQALFDATLCINEGAKNILVGAADEMEEVLYNMKVRLNIQDSISAYGASFFILTSEKKADEYVMLLDVASIGMKNDLINSISECLKSNNIPADEIDLILFSSSNQNTFTELEKLFNKQKLLDFQKLSGLYFTNSAFAMNYAIDLLTNESSKEKIILVCNNLVPENLGLILMKN